MKRVLSLFVLFAVTYTSYGQASIVYDPTVASKIIETIDTGLDQLEEIERMANYYEEARDKLKTINKAVSEIKNIKKIVESSKEIMEGANRAKNAIAKIADPKSRQKNTNYLLKIIRNTKEANDELRKILKENYLELSDKERMDLIKEQEKIIRNNKARMKMYYNFSD
ncbi:hypothetical protein [Capnocytophaga gingivalis]|jgi:hypothetical protein|uniref:hypothetical protein n=1 Tax=Capnocytophaga gingivalis TaxID=1017 RepID=UPI003C718F1D